MVGFLFVALLKVTLVYFLLFFLGRLLVKFLLPEKKIHPFLSTLACTLLTVTVYALFITNCNSLMLINLLLIIALVLYLRIKKNNSFFESNIDLEYSTVKLFLLSTASLILLFCYFSFELFCFNGEARHLNPDYSFYARLAQYFNDFGVENLVPDYLNSNRGDPSPYHYTEIWLAAIYSKLLGLSTQYTLILGAFVLIFNLLILGADYYSYYIIQKYNIYKRYLVASLILFISACAYLYPNFVALLEMDIWVAALVNFLKLSVIAVFLIPFLLAIRFSNYVLIAFSVAFLIVNYITLAPALLIMLGLFFVFKLIGNKKTAFSYLLDLAPAYLTLATCLSFYLINSEGQGEETIPSLLEIIAYLVSSDYYRTFFNIVIKISLQILITISPFFLIYFFLSKRVRPRKETLFWLVFIVLSSILSWASIWFMHDSVQFFGNLFIPFINIFLFTLFLVLLKENQKLPIYLFLLIILFNSFLNQSNYWQVKQRFKVDDTSYLKDDSRIAYLTDNEDHQSFFSHILHVYQGGIYSPNRNMDRPLLFCLSADQISTVNDNEKKVLEMSPFYNYIQAKKDSCMNCSSLDLKKDFINSIGIDYLLVSRSRPLPQDYKDLFSPHAIGKVDGFSVYQSLR